MTAISAPSASPATRPEPPADTQIRFDASWETKVLDRILHNLGLLLGQSFKTAQQLNHTRKELGRQMAASLESGATSHAS